MNQSISSGFVGQPADLRTRIAAAIYNASDEYTRKLLVRPDCPGASELEGDGKPVCYILADAVIRELGLDGHTESFIDADGDERCSTCDKWLEPGYYTLRDHRTAMLRDVVDEWTADE